jgi:hypothetical protein
VGAMKSGPKPVGFFFGKYPHDTEVNLVRSWTLLPDPCPPMCLTPTYCEHMNTVSLFSCHTPSAIRLTLMEIITDIRSWSRLPTWMAQLYIRRG